MREHVCEEATGCICYGYRLEPDEDCPTHGYPYPYRCGTCGRFFKKQKTKREEIALLRVPF
jgi:hypothetical protein